jgi:hypothetical protein
MPFPPSFNELMAFVKNMPKEYDDKMRVLVADSQFKALSEEEKKDARMAFVIAFYAEAQRKKQQEEHEEDQDGFEDCECGYTHHYEDKCPNEATAEHYEKWRKEEEMNHL